MPRIADPEEGGISLGFLKRELKAYYIAVESDGSLEITDSQVCLEESEDSNTVSHAVVSPVLPFRLVYLLLSSCRIEFFP